MAQLDTSIYGALLRPVKSVAEYDAEARKGQLDQLALLEAQDKRADSQQKRTRFNQLQSLMAGGANSEQLRRGGFAEEAFKLDKNASELRKEASTIEGQKATTAATKFRLNKEQSDSLTTKMQQFKSPDDVRKYLGDAVEKAQAGDPSGFQIEYAKQMWASVPQDPAEFQGWLTKLTRSRMSPEQVNAATTVGANTQANIDATASEGVKNRASRERAASIMASGANQGPDGPIVQGETGPGRLNKAGTAVEPLTGPGGAPWKPPVKAASGSADQRKSQFLLEQGTNAIRNMESALKKYPGAEAPDVAQSVVGAVPIIGENARKLLESPGRQMYRAADSQLTEALIRTASGANAPKHEFDQKMRETTIGPLDSPGLRAQKMRDKIMYLKALQHRAGVAEPTKGNDDGRAARLAAAMGEE